MIARLWLTDCLISNADPATCERDPQRVVMHEVNQVLALAQRAGASEIVPDLRVVITAADRVGRGRFSARSDHRPPRAALDRARQHDREPPRAVPAAARRSGGRWWRRTAPMRSNWPTPCAPPGSPTASTGGLTFGQWAAAFERAACIVTIDTGATHVASAVKRPTIVLFEHAYFWLNSQEWSPYRVPNAVLRKPPTDAPQALQASRAEIVAAVARLL